jgi:glycosyltransferase involved in cell wall biosynthesis
MKVLFNTYPMAFHTPGGGEVQLLQYRQHLQIKNTSVTMFDLWEPHLLDFNLVHFFSCIGGSVHFCAFVKSIGLPLVISPNLWITSENKHLYPGEEIRTLFVLADKVIGNSDLECDLLASVFNIPRDKFATVYNGINEIFFRPTNADIFRKHFGINGQFILNVANIEPRKNQIQLARALKNFPDLKLVIIGYERDSEYAKLLYEEAGDQLIYLGPLPHESELLRSAYAACELFALPSTLETPGLATLEASAIGTRILVTAEGSAVEYFGDGAIYVNPEDFFSISQGIAEALLRPKLEVLSLTMRGNFTWHGAVNTLSGIYSELMGTRSETGLTESFYPVEFDGSRYFAWSKRKVNFYYSSGTLLFIWRSVNGATVDVYFDLKLSMKDVYVSANWTAFSLDIPSQPDGVLCHISFVVKIDDHNSDDGRRDLGVAISEVMFTSKFN